MKTALCLGDTVGLIACSDGRKKESTIVKEIVDTLTMLGLRAKLAQTIFRKGDSPFSGKATERANELMTMFRDDRIKMIFDISGGDSANQILPYLDEKIIKKNPKPFVGLSDLSVLLNAIYVRTQVPTFHYQIANLVKEDASTQLNLFRKWFMEKETDGANEITFQYRWLRGQGMKGVVIGGNIRCFLKLAGTPYMPDPTNKILFLESLGGGISRTASLLAQLQQIGFLEQCQGLLLGTFTEIHSQNQHHLLEELILEMTKEYPFPIATTEQLGHGADAHCLSIGRFLTFP